MIRFVTYKAVKYIPILHNHICFCILYFLGISYAINFMLPAASETLLEYLTDYLTDFIIYGLVSQNDASQ